MEWGPGCAAHKPVPPQRWLQTFIKTVNYNHLMPTRYTLDADFKNVTNDVLENSTKKVEARKVSSRTRTHAFLVSMDGSRDAGGGGRGREALAGGGRQQEQPELDEPCSSAEGFAHGYIKQQSCWQ